VQRSKGCDALSKKPKSAERFAGTRTAL